MDKDMLLAKTALPEGWIDMGIGEALCVRQALFGTCRSLKGWSPARSTDMSYPGPQGSPALLKALKELTPYDCVVTQGAKMGLLTVFMAAKRLGKKFVSSPVPYWTSFPSLAEAAGLVFRPLDVSQNILWNPTETVYVFTSPNNPDGSLANIELVRQIKEKGGMIVHDAVYDTPSYVMNSFTTRPMCDVRMYSASKMFGLSGLRLGWIEVVNEDLMPLLLDIVETSTSGVATHSQAYVTDVINMLTESDKWEEFHEKASDAIETNRKNLLDHVSPTMTPESVRTARGASGMFAWLQPNENFKPEETKVRVIDGKAFGMPGWIRVSLGGGAEDCLKAALRLGGRGEV